MGQNEWEPAVPAPPQREEEHAGGQGGLVFIPQASMQNGNMTMLNPLPAERPVEMQDLFDPSAPSFLLDRRPFIGHYVCAATELQYVTFLTTRRSALTAAALMSVAFHAMYVVLNGFVRLSIPFTDVNITGFDSVSMVVATVVAVFNTLFCMRGDTIARPRRRQRTAMLHEALAALLVLAWAVIPVISFWYHARCAQTNVGQCSHHWIDGIWIVICLVPVFSFSVRPVFLVGQLCFNYFCYVMPRVTAVLRGIYTYHQLGASIVMSTAMAVSSLVVLWAFDRQSRQRFEHWVMLQRNVTALTASREGVRSALRQLLPESVLENIRADRPMVELSQRCTVAALRISDYGRWTWGVTPREQTAVLSRLVHVCDEALRSFAVDRLRVIGDLYVVSSGLRAACRSATEAAVNCVRFMLMQSKRVANLAAIASAAPFGVLVGVGTGWCGAGFVGVRSLWYEGFGEALDIALALLRASPPDKVTVCGATRESYAGAFVDEPALLSIPFPSFFVSGVVSRSVPRHESHAAHRRARSSGGNVGSPANRQRSRQHHASAPATVVHVAGELVVAPGIAASPPAALGTIPEPSCPTENVSIVLSQEEVRADAITETLMVPARSPSQSGASSNRSSFDHGGGGTGSQVSDTTSIIRRDDDSSVGESESVVVVAAPEEERTEVLQSRFEYLRACVVGGAPSRSPEALGPLPNLDPSNGSASAAVPSSRGGSSLGIPENSAKKTTLSSATAPTVPQNGLFGDEELDVLEAHLAEAPQRWWRLDFPDISLEGQFAEYSIVEDMREGTVATGFALVFAVGALIVFFVEQFNTPVVIAMCVLDICFLVLRLLSRQLVDTPIPPWESVASFVIHNTLLLSAIWSSEHGSLLGAEMDHYFLLNAMLSVMWLRRMPWRVLAVVLAALLGASLAAEFTRRGWGTSFMHVTATLFGSMIAVLAYLHERNARAHFGTYARACATGHAAETELALQRGMLRLIVPPFAVNAVAKYCCYASNDVFRPVSISADVCVLLLRFDGLAETLKQQLLTESPGAALRVIEREFAAVDAALAGVHSKSAMLGRHPRAFRVRACGDEATLAGPLRADDDPANLGEGKPLTYEDTYFAATDLLDVAAAVLRRASHCVAVMAVGQGTMSIIGKSPPVVDVIGPVARCAAALMDAAPIIDRRVAVGTVTPPSPVPPGEHTYMTSSLPRGLSINSRLPATSSIVGADNSGGSLLGGSIQQQQQQQQPQQQQPRLNRRGSAAPRGGCYIGGVAYLASHAVRLLANFGASIPRRHGDLVPIAQHRWRLRSAGVDVVTVARLQGTSAGWSSLSESIDRNGVLGRSGSVHSGGGGGATTPTVGPPGRQPLTFPNSGGFGDDGPLPMPRLAGDALSSTSLLDTRAGLPREVAVSQEQETLVTAFGSQQSGLSGLVPVAQFH